MVAFTLAARLFVLLRAEDSPLFAQQPGDSTYYLAWGARIAAGEWTDGQAFYGLPLYPSLLGGLSALGNPLPWTILFFQILADALVALLIFDLAVWVGATRIPGASSIDPATFPLLASLGWLLFVPAQSLAISVMPNTLAVLAFWTLANWFLRGRFRSPIGQGLLAGLALGVCAMLSANVLFLLLLLPFAFWRGGETRRWGASARRVLAGSCCAALGVGLGCSPSWYHNYFVARDGAVLSAHGGVNFFIGNNPEANGYPSFPKGMRPSQAGMLADSIIFAERASGHPLKRSEVSRFWSQQAWRFISENPFACMRLLGRKIRNYFSAFEYDDISVMYAFREQGITLPGLSFGSVALAGLTGFAAAWRERPRLRWVAAVGALHLFSVLPAFVTERYRLVAVPALLVGFAGGAEYLLEKIRGGLPRSVLTRTLLPMGLAGALVLWPQRDPKLGLLNEYNYAVRLFDAGAWDEAYPLMQRVYAQSSDNAELNLLLGNYWLAKGKTREAVQFYRTALALDPQLTRAWNNAASIAVDEEKWEFAERCIAHVLEQSPGNPKALFLRARILSARGELESSEAALNQAAASADAPAGVRELRREVIRRRLEAWP